MAQKRLGIMLDCSRNAVMKPEKVKEFAKLMAGMGYNMLQLYTEDTYEIDGEPFFGHMRGRYSQEELQDIDSYCVELGVELIPCIQVLAHLNQLTQWDSYRELFDCNDILMVGEESVYELIDKMFATLAKCFTARRVNVGMDEAHFLGRGRYQDKNGYREHIDIFMEHLTRVKEIADKYGFTLMMWSDMFIRLLNNGQYEFCKDDIQLPREIMERVPEGVELIYWNYYSKDKADYEHMLQVHEKFNHPIGFAGGLWTWTGFAPNLQFAYDATEAAMKSVREHSVDTVFFTLWGDNGKECSYFSTLPVMFAAAKMAEGNFDKEDIAKQFEEKYGYTFEEFMNLELVNITKEEPSHHHNPCKYLLFNDPFIGVYDFTVREDLSERYEWVTKELAKSVNGRKYDYLFDMYRKLAKVLVQKVDLGVRLRKAYQSGDREGLTRIAEQNFPNIKQDLQDFFDVFCEMWLQENKPFGLEVQEQRFGGLLYRMDRCERRLRAYLNGEIEMIDELEEMSLAKFKGYEGEAVTQNNWCTTITTCVM